jgi:two-component system cell cycle sensor histidine kinase/response regulator CckA
MTSIKAETRDPRATILVVEDESALLGLARLILEGCGYRVLCAATRAEAIEEWEKAQGKVDLLLTDMLLPKGASGRELADLLRAQNPNLKIIFTSALGEAEFHADLREQNARFLQKPYTKPVLAQTVRECLEG